MWWCLKERKRKCLRGTFCLLLLFLKVTLVQSHIVFRIYATHSYLFIFFFSVPSPFFSETAVWKLHKPSRRYSTNSSSPRLQKKTFLSWTPPTNRRSCEQSRVTKKISVRVTSVWSLSWAASRVCRYINLVNNWSETNKKKKDRVRNVNVPPPEAEPLPPPPGVEGVWFLDFSP